MGKGAKTKGYIKNTNTGRVFKFQYNPTSFSTGRSVKYTELDSPGTAYPMIQYVGGSSRDFELKIFLNGGRKEGNDVGSKGYPKWFHSQMIQFIPAEKSVANFTRPVELIVAYGSFVKRCVVVGIDEEYVDFHEDLTPKTINLTMKFKVVA